MAVLKSKKFWACIVGLVVVLLNHLVGLSIDPETELKIVGLIGAFIVGQGIADNGKEATKIAAGKSSANLPAVDPK